MSFIPIMANWPSITMERFQALIPITMERTCHNQLQKRFEHKRLMPALMDSTVRVRASDEEKKQKIPLLVGNRKQKLVSCFHLRDLNDRDKVKSSY
jgi:hydroxyacyl-ACP dehydratase HTD2-like protein with hotdog domain